MSYFCSNMNYKKHYFKYLDEFLLKRNYTKTKRYKIFHVYKGFYIELIIYETNDYKLRHIFIDTMNKMILKTYNLQINEYKPTARRRLKNSIEFLEKRYHGDI